MINHKHKLIFIHIPRTGGTSIERALCGRDWLNIHAPSKHLTAHTAKKIYSEYWDEYFKFTFVRNPWDRMVSLLKYGQFYGVSLDIQDIIRSENYFMYFKKIEYDKRYFNENQFNDFNTINESVYQNIFGVEMDFIGKFENLEEDFSEICLINNIINKKLPHVEKSHHRKNYNQYYDSESIQLIEKKYNKDIKLFNYEF